MSSATDARVAALMVDRWGDNLPTWSGPGSLMDAAGMVGVAGDLWNAFSDAALRLIEAPAAPVDTDELVAFCRKLEPVKFAEKVARERANRPADDGAALEVIAARWVLNHAEERRDRLKDRLDERLRILLARDDYRFAGIRNGNLDDRVPARLARQVSFDYYGNRIVLQGRGTARTEIWEHVTVESPARREAALGDEDALAEWATRVCAAVHGAGKRISRDTFTGLALARFGSGLTVDRVTAAWTKARATTDWPASGAIPAALRIDEDALQELLKMHDLLRKP